MTNRDVRNRRSTAIRAAVIRLLWLEPHPIQLASLRDVVETDGGQALTRARQIAFVWSAPIEGVELVLREIVALGEHEHTLERLHLLLREHWEDLGESLDNLAALWRDSA